MGVPQRTTMIWTAQIDAYSDVAAAGDGELGAFRGGGDEGPGVIREDTAIWPAPSQTG